MCALGLQWNFACLGVVQLFSVRVCPACVLHHTEWGSSLGVIGERELQWNRYDYMDHAVLCGSIQALE